MGKIVKERNRFTLLLYSNCFRSKVNSNFDGVFQDKCKIRKLFTFIFLYRDSFD